MVREAIDSAFLRSNRAITLGKAGIRDAGFIYLLTKETNKVVKLHLGK